MLSKIKNNWQILFILVIALGVRMVHINQSFWLDEAAQASESARPLQEQFDIKGDFQPPLYHVLLHFLMAFGKQEWFLRLISVVAGTATIGATYYFGKVFFDKKTALIASLLGALSAYHYYYSLELRPYALSVFWAVISMYGFLKIIESSKKKIQWVYVVPTILGIYTTYLIPFLLVSQLLTTLALYRKKINLVIKHQLIATAFFIPWLPYFFEQLLEGMALKANYIGWSTAVSLPAIKSLPLTLVRFLIGNSRVDPTVIQIASFTLLAVILLYIASKALKNKYTVPVMLWATLPIVGAFTVSFWIPVLEPKRVLYCLPAVWLLLASGLTQLKMSKLLVSACIVMWSIPLYVHFSDPSLQREDWRSSVSYIEESGEKDKSIVLFAFPGEFAPYTWYKKNKLDTIATKVFTVESQEYLDESIKNVLLYDQVFVYDYLMDLSDPNRYIHSWLSKNGYQEIKVVDFRGLGFVRVFSKSSPLATVL